MKATPLMDPTAAFSDPVATPVDADLPKALGPAGAPLVALLADFRDANPLVTTTWQFSVRSGWYQLHLLKKRRLLYLIPKCGDFRASMILGPKAVAQLQQGPFARRTAAALKTAKRYPEGIAFSFDRQSLDPKLLATFLTAKLAH